MIIKSFMHKEEHFEVLAIKEAVSQLVLAPKIFLLF
jgi:hypothetical protein